MSNKPIELKTLYNCKSFPLYYYEERKSGATSSIFDAEEEKYIRRDGVSDFIVDRARKQYVADVAKEDIFYYVYGFLHSPDYQSSFAHDLKKILPHIPLLKDESDFWAFSEAESANSPHFAIHNQNETVKGS